MDDMRLNLIHRQLHSSTNFRMMNLIVHQFVYRWNGTLFGMFHSLFVGQRALYLSLCCCCWFCCSSISRLNCFCYLYKKHVLVTGLNDNINLAKSSKNLYFSFHVYIFCFYFAHLPDNVEICFSARLYLTWILHYT